MGEFIGIILCVFAVVTVDWFASYEKASTKCGNGQYPVKIESELSWNDVINFQIICANGKKYRVN